ncbi:hypothetical protein [Devosia sp. Naph2]|uniref:hypothetical protein n=1 Tax=Devosia polycyclovorans TaxID=3345148 RepID=UPI0035D0E45F
MASNIVSGILRPIVTPLVTATPIKGGGPPAGFAFIRTVPGTVMVDQNNRRVIGVALAGQGVAA